MSWLHQHTWTVVGAKYNPRPEELRSAKGQSAELLREAIYGFTVVTQKCTDCGRVDFTRTPGKPDLSEPGVEWKVS